ncbi:MAG: hypothetical protein ACXVIH_12980 [Ilumatobacteraceae bacterium]
MPAITLVLIVLAAVCTFVIAAVVVGREARRLDSVAPRSVYIVDEAVEFVAEYLPPDTQGRLTPDELEQLLTFHMRWLHAKGLQPPNVVDRRQDITTPVVVTEDTLTGYLLGEAERNGIEILDDVDVVRVVDAHHAYFEAIGAVGPRATATELDETRAALAPERAPAARLDANDDEAGSDHHVEVVDDTPTE